MTSSVCDLSLIEKFIRATLKGIQFARNDRSGTIPIVSKDLKVEESLAAKTYDLYKGAMSSNGTIGEDLQKKSLEVYLKLAGIKTQPPLDRMFDFKLTRKIFNELESTGWR